MRNDQIEGVLVKGKYFVRKRLKNVILVLPVVVLLCTLSVYPVLRGIWLGFTGYKVGRRSLMVLTIISEFIIPAILVQLLKILASCCLYL